MKYLFLAILLIFGFCKNAEASCSPEGSTGSAICDTEGDASSWVHSQAHQFQGCAAIYAPSVELLNVTYSTASHSVGANFTCKRFIDGDAYTGPAYISATYQTACISTPDNHIANENYSGYISCNIDTQCRVANVINPAGGVDQLAIGGTCTANNVQCPAGFHNTDFGIESVCAPDAADDDGDGIPNDQDDFPQNPNEQHDSDHDGTGDNADAFPNNPNEHSDRDGDGVGDNGDHKPDDPDDGKDNGEGDEKDNTSSGGGDCKTPPNSKGDAILAQIAYQAWSTRCAVTAKEKSAGGGQNCTVAPTCAGDGCDALQQANVYQTWKTRCATEALLAKATPVGGNGDDENGQPDWTKVGGMTGDGHQGEGAGDKDVFEEKGINFMSLIDRGGFLSHSCPYLPTIDLGTYGSYTPDSVQWCRLIEILGQLFVLMAGIAAGKILMA